MTLGPPLVRADCPRCGSARSHQVLSGRDRLHEVEGTYYVASCDDCRLWFQNPRPSRESIGELYPAEYGPHSDKAMPALRDGEVWILRNEYGYHHLSASVARPGLIGRWHGRWRARMELRPRFVEGGHLVEIGSASGARLVHLRGLGWTRLEGIEIVPAAAEAARSLGLTVHTTSIEDGIELYDDESIDTIVTSMVIEHLVNPFDVLKKLTAKLKPGGELLFSTVVRDRFDARLWGTHWRNLDLPRHMVWFALPDIKRALEPSFENLQIHHQAEAIDFTGSAHYRAAEERHLLDSVLLLIGERRMAFPTLALSLAGLTSRIVVRAVKKPPSLR